MTSNSEPDKVWQRIEQLFRLREKLKKDMAEENSRFDAIKIEEVESVIYRDLFPQIEAFIFSLQGGNVPKEEVTEITHEAIGRMFNAYSSFQGQSSLRTYFARIVEHLVIDYVRKISKERDRVIYDEEAIAAAADKQALDEFHERTRGAEDTIADSAASILEEINFKTLGLTDKEFVAVVLKLASNCLMKEKLTDEELANRLGMKRVTFVDAYLRGRDKICRHLKERCQGGKIS